MDSEDLHVDVEKSPEPPDHDIKPIISTCTSAPTTCTPPTVSATQQTAQPLLSAPSTSVLSSTSVTSIKGGVKEPLVKSPGSAAGTLSSSGGEAASSVTVLTPSKQHQRVFHTGTKQPVVVLRDFAGRQSGKRKRSPRRDSPKRGFRMRRVSFPSQPHPGFEPCVLAKAKVWLPIDVIEEPFIFNEIVSLDTWDNVLSEKDRDRLSELLPEFPDNDDKEKRETLKRLFGGDNFQFGNPADALQKKIQSGRLHPDVIRADRLCQKQKHKEYKYRQQRRAHKLLKDILISRQELLEAAQYTAPHEPIRVKKPKPKPVHHEFDDRVAKKYRRVLRDVRQECGDLDTSDEDDKYEAPEPPVTTKTWLDILAEMNPPHSSVTSVQATTAPKPTPYELGLTGSSPIMNPQALQSDSPRKMTDADFMSMLEKHQRRRKEEEEQFDLDTSSVHLHDVVGRVYGLHRSPAPGAIPTFAPPRTPKIQKKKRKDKDKIKRKKEKKAQKLAAKAAKLKAAAQALQAPPAAAAKPPDPRPIKIEPQTSLDEMALTAVKPATHTTASIKVEPVNPRPITAPAKPQVTQPTSVMTSGFLVLLKEIITSSPNQTITLQELESRVTSWQRSPASLLCGWLSLEPNWTKVTGHAVRFMSGAIPTVVPVEPRVQFDIPSQGWKWIGHGRDSNDELVHLFKQWLSVLPEETVPLPTELPLTPVSESSSRRVETVTNIPSPRMKTDYVVKTSTEEEKKQFREQERQRYEHPHKAFTYHAHGYESVVGPVKGVFGKESSLTKAREHSLLVSERPPYVTILSLVRDAVARLPNGEGTRSEVCELLKDSQFLSLSIDTHLNTVVSGALDRLHYEKDPCVKYDTTRKMWIYLHRNRDEGEFERLHKEVAANVKAKKAMPRTQRPVPKVKTIKEQSVSPSSSILLETSNDSTSTNPRMETPSPTQSHASASGVITSRMMTPSPASSMMQFTPQPTSPQIALSGPRQGMPGPGQKQSVQQQILNAQLLRSVLPMSGIQVTAVRTPSTEGPPLPGQHGMGGDGKMDAASGTSLIKAQLLAPRVGQLPAQLHPYASQQQVMLTSEAAARGTQMSADLRNQLLAQSLARSLSMPAGVPLSRPPMTSMPGNLPHQVQAQQIALSLAGARGNAPGAQRPPTAADLLKQDLALQALQAQAQAGVPGTTAGSSTVNVTLTLKRAQSMDSPQFSPGVPRQPSNPVRMPTVGSLLAGLGMPHGNVPIHTGRQPAKKSRSRSKKSSSQTLASLAMQHGAVRGPAPMAGVSHGLATSAHQQIPLTSFGLPTKEGQQSKGKVVTIQALTGPQMATRPPTSVAKGAATATSTATAALFAGAGLTQAATAALQQQNIRTTAATTTISTTSAGIPARTTAPVSSSATPTTATTKAVTTVATTVTQAKPTPATRAPAVRRAAQPKSQKISKMIAQPGRIPEVRYSLPTGRKTPPAASHAAAIHRLALQMTQPVSQAAVVTGASGKTTAATQGMQKTRPQSPKTSGIVLGSLGKLEEGKPGVATIPMSLLLQGQAMAQSGQLPKGALPVQLSSQLLGNLPVSVAQGKGLIFQMPPGSKIVTAVPVTSSGNKSPAHAAVTTTGTTTSGNKSPAQATAAVKTPPRQKSPAHSAVSATMTQSTSVKTPARQKSPVRSVASPSVSQPAVIKTTGSKWPARVTAAPKTPPRQKSPVRSVTPGILSSQQVPPKTSATAATSAATVKITATATGGSQTATAAATTSSVATAGQTKQKTTKLTPSTTASSKTNA